MLTSNLTFFSICAKKKNHCELDFWSIWTNFASKYAQKLKVFDKKRQKKGILWVKNDKKTFHPPKKNRLMAIFMTQKSFLGEKIYIYIFLYQKCLKRIKIKLNIIL